MIITWADLTHCDCGYYRGVAYFYRTLLALVGLSWWSFAPTRDCKHLVQRDIYPLMFKYFSLMILFIAAKCASMNRLVAAKVFQYDK